MSSMWFQSGYTLPTFGTGQTTTTTPTGTVDVGTTPFIRENDIDFSVKNLKPAKTANIFFDQILVNNLSQRASIVNVASAASLSAIKVNEGIFSAASFAYAEVLGTSRTDTQNLLYVNDNFLSIYLIKNAIDTTDFTSTDFNVDDIVYQTADNSMVRLLAAGSPGNAGYYAGTVFGVDVPNYVFYGKVKKWYLIDANQGILVVEPLEGRANTTVESGTSNFLFNSMGNGRQRKAEYLRANARFAAGETINYASNGTVFGAVSSSSGSQYVALSSIVPKVNTSANLRTLIISSNNFTRDGLANVISSNATAYIVSGTNQGFSSKIVQMNPRTDYNELLLENAMPAFCTSNSVYSIGQHIVDDVGSLFGILHIPSETNLKWPVGQRVFTVTDTATYNDNNYDMRAIATYTSTGLVNTVENARNFVLAEQTPSSMKAPVAITQPSAKVNDRKYMSQTFFTPKKAEIANNQIKTSYGMFLSSLDLYFYSKPTTSGELLPFSVAITRVDNRIPTDDVLAQQSMDQQSIVVSSFPSLANTATRTRFTFSDPVFLLPETEYAIRLHTESPDYQVWTATVGDNVVDDSGISHRVSEQPYVGNFFTSQNASNWNPIENQDLMFNINRAVFSLTGTFYMNLKPADLKLPVLADQMKLSFTEQQFTPTNITYELKSKLIDSSDAGYLTIKNNEIYNFARDLNISSTSAKKRRLIRANQADDANVRITLTTTDDAVSPVVNRERAGMFALQNIINNSGIANTLISITSRGSGYSVGNTVNVTISMPDVGTNQAIANVLPGMLGSNGEIQGINIINPGSGYFTTPTITIQTGVADTLNVGRNAAAKINGETDATGGNGLAKYQTKIVTLSDGFESGDLIVRLDAIRPVGTDVQVYFKVLSGQDSEAFIDKKWQRMNKVSDTYSQTANDSVPLEYRYNVDTGSVNYIQDGKALPLGGKFKYFAIKIRLSAADPSVIPAVDSLRVIAVPGG